MYSLCRTLSCTLVHLERLCFCSSLFAVPPVTVGMVLAGSSLDLMVFIFVAPHCYYNGLMYFLPTLLKVFSYSALTQSWSPNTNITLLYAQ